MLALALGGRTVAEWRACMSEAEFRSWAAFYRHFPFDDVHRYHRPAALIGASMGGDYAEKFRFLAPEPVPDGYTEADMNTFKAFGFKPPTKE